MTKKELIEKMAKQLNRSQLEIKKTVEAMLAIISEEMAAQRPVTLVGFGSFEVRNRGSRLGRNPKTGESLIIEATHTPVFIAGKTLTDKVKGR